MTIEDATENHDHIMHFCREWSATDLDEVMISRSNACNGQERIIQLCYEWNATDIDGDTVLWPHTEDTNISCSCSMVEAPQRSTKPWSRSPTAVTPISCACASRSNVAVSMNCHCRVFTMKSYVYSNRFDVIQRATRR